ncbi:MAG TPA: twin-arginine translocation signal domain-containing protein [Bryobacteraceae bacterium]|nr:twin-arginine translocation signal domain-containing protein [Bryobacteraceae bacterium]
MSTKTTRRGFLGAATATAAAGLLPANASATVNNEAGSFKLGVTMKGALAALK